MYKGDYPDLGNCTGVIYKNVFVSGKYTSKYLGIKEYYVCNLLSHSSEIICIETKWLSKCSKMLTSGESGWWIHRNSSYYFWNFSVSLKLFHSKKFKTALKKLYPDDTFYLYWQKFLSLINSLQGCGQASPLINPAGE